MKPSTPFGMRIPKDQKSKTKSKTGELLSVHLGRCYVVSAEIWFICFWLDRDHGNGECRFMSLISSSKETIHRLMEVFKHCLDEGYPVEVFQKAMEKMAQESVEKGNCKEVELHPDKN